VAEAPNDMFLLEGKQKRSQQSAGGDGVRRDSGLGSSSVRYADHDDKGDGDDGVEDEVHRGMLENRRAWAVKKRAQIVRKANKEKSAAAGAAAASTGGGRGLTVGMRSPSSSSLSRQSNRGISGSGMLPLSLPTTPVRTVGSKSTAGLRSPVSNSNNHQRSSNQQQEEEGASGLLPRIVVSPPPKARRSR
jgi:hypothetical protein